jgi:hypothetical protein
MARIDGTSAPSRTRALLSAGVGVAVLAALVAPGWIARATVDASTPSFPTEVGSYAWWTAPLAGGDVDAAVMLYQSGYGVEFLDTPQAVVLSSDGVTYRRHSTSESLSGAADQGDPADSVLSPDRTTIVTAGLHGEGIVTVTTVATGATTEVSIGGGLNAIPVSIDSAGSVLLVVSESDLSPLLDREFRLHGRLARLDLASGAVVDYPDLSDVSSAALSPDGARIAVDTAEGIVVADRDGAGAVTVLPQRADVRLDGDAWAPDGSRLAVYGADGLSVIDVSPDEPVVTTRIVDPELVGTIIGWRDDSTALLHATDTTGSNESSFSWVDASTGRLDTFSTYIPDFTGAALGGPDVARDLITSMESRPLVGDRGWFPVVGAFVVAVAAGLLTWRVLPSLVSVARRFRDPSGGVARHEARLQLDPGR